MSDQAHRPRHGLLIPAAGMMLAVNAFLVVTTFWSDSGTPAVRVTPRNEHGDAAAVAATTAKESDLAQERESPKPSVQPVAAAVAGLVEHRGGAAAGLAADVQPETQVRAIERRRPLPSAEELLAGLSDVPTLDLFASPDDVDDEEEKRRYRRLRNRIALSPTRPPELVLPNPLDGPLWRGARRDLAGLPLLEGDDCRLPEEESAALRRVSVLVGPVAARAGDAVNVGNSRLAAGVWYEVNASVDGAEEAFDPSGLHQILQIAPVQTRRMLVRKLAEDESPQATKALTQRALFDFDASIRRDAVEALGDRAPDAYSRELLVAFEHPWAPAAEHAADALVALGRTDLVGSLRDLVTKPDPRAPFQDHADRWYVRELVRVNHLRNCLLCHAPNRVPFADEEQGPFEGVIADTSATVGEAEPSPYVPEGVVPDPYAPLPRVYYGSPRGADLFVRADITYVWQDFSAVMTVENPRASWPSRQRFDFFVRKRHVSEVEADRLSGRYPRIGSPHRRAALVALQVLTGQT